MIDIEPIISYIQSVYYGEKGANYVGGTLTFPLSLEEETVIIFCNFTKATSARGNANITQEYLFWLSACYLKYKTSDYQHYNESLEVVKNFDDQFLSSKILLEVS